MKRILLLVCLTTNVACAADLYKCVKDGRTSYQSNPCEGTSSATQLQAGHANSLPGCYVVDLPGFENGFEIKRTANDSFKLDTASGKDKQSLPMKSATPEELREVGAAFHLNLREGVSVKWDKGTPNQKPIGVYKGQDERGKEVVFAFLFLANGLATKAQCK
jgi:Domain of unknown function (DUF4124)